VKCEIGAGAFRFSRSLTTLTIGTGRTTIERATFHSCPALASVRLPSTVQQIGDEAFRGCPALTTTANPKRCRAYAMALRGADTVVTRG
jgi:hypothetical protein